ncbi:hypothetical protein PoB_002631900 [Plakobranchus ocellatus]|uniref:Uncharacterized protein n=1 Tax=Plakobranchus ocellatus TaxID=259542 RepID=A0AAV3ZZM5_9GAST|nr:hypothetical protein PoB_002631900 [Plakobranchus ocellatus]
MKKKSASKTSVFSTIINSFHLLLAFGRFLHSLPSEFVLRSAGSLLLRVRAPSPAPWPDGGPEKPEITLLWAGYIQKRKKITTEKPPTTMEQQHIKTKTFLMTSFLQQHVAFSFIYLFISTNDRIIVSTLLC